MSAATNYFKLNGRSRLLVSCLHLLRLLKRRLRIFIAVEEKERRRMRIHMENWAGKTREFRLLVRLATEKKLERGEAHAPAMRRRLLKDRREIGHPEEAHDTLHIGGSSPGAHETFEFALPRGNAHQLRQMAARRCARDHDRTRLQTEFRSRGSQKSKSRFNIMQLRRKWSDFREAVIHARDGKPSLHEMTQRHVRLRPRPPGAAMNPNDQRRMRSSGEIQIEREFLPGDFSVNDVALN